MSAKQQQLLLEQFRQQQRMSSPASSSATDEETIEVAKQEELAKSYYTVPARQEEDEEEEEAAQDDDQREEDGQQSSCSESGAANSSPSESGDQYVAQNYTTNDKAKLLCSALDNESKQSSSADPAQMHVKNELVASFQVQQQQPAANKKKPSDQLAANENSYHEQVKHVDLFGYKIVALAINDKDRLCLAQISNTLLKDFSYNEIHNRRVALGITCVQCTPIQLEMLRRAGAMPSSSRRCGMITMREAERLCRSFLAEEQPPELPDNFYFTVAHRVNYGCKGRFVPARYISSRAKCIECFYCGEFYSPNKFIFHSHRQPFNTDCNPPDSPNINSWRKHIDLDWTQDHHQDIKYAWEDVKSLFNGGTRRRAAPSSSEGQTLTSGGANSGDRQRVSSTRRSATLSSAGGANTRELDVVVDVDRLEETTASAGASSILPAKEAKLMPLTVSERRKMPMGWPQRQQQSINNRSSTQPVGSNKRHASSLAHQQPSAKKFSAANLALEQPEQQSMSGHHQQIAERRYGNAAPATCLGHEMQQQQAAKHQLELVADLNSRRFNPPRVPNLALASGARQETNCVKTDQTHPAHTSNTMSQNFSDNKSPANFIYNQLYTQLIQSQQQQQHHHQQHHQQQHQRPPVHLNSLETQLALRHQIWSSLLANLQTHPAAAAAAAAAAANSSAALSILQGPPAAYAGAAVAAATSHHQQAVGGQQPPSQSSQTPTNCTDPSASNSSTFQGLSHLFPMQMYSHQTVESIFGDHESAMK